VTGKSHSSFLILIILIFLTLSVAHNYIAILERVFILFIFKCIYYFSLTRLYVIL